jgi:hypothetical protein
MELEARCRTCHVCCVGMSVLLQDCDGARRTGNVSIRMPHLCAASCKNALLMILVLSWLDGVTKPAPAVRQGT